MGTYKQIKKTSEHTKHKPRLNTQKNTQPNRAVWTGPGSCAHGTLPMYKLNARDHFNCSPLIFSWPAPRNRCGQMERGRTMHNKQRYHPSRTFTVIKHLCITWNWINHAVKMYSSPLTFCKVVRQQIWGEVVSFLRGSFLSLTVTKWRKLVHFLRKLSQKNRKLSTLFRETRFLSLRLNGHFTG